MPRLTKAEKNRQTIAKWLDFFGASDFNTSYTIGIECWSLMQDLKNNGELLYSPVDHRDYMVVSLGNTAYIIELNARHFCYKPETLDRWNNAVKAVKKELRPLWLEKHPYANHSTWKDDRRIASSIIWYCEFSDHY